MQIKFKILRLKILLVILGVLLIIFIGAFIQKFFSRGEVAERFEVTMKSEIAEAIKEEQSKVEVSKEETYDETVKEPFKITNIDTIRVLITNKETGSIYHEEADSWENRTDYRGILEIIEEKEGYVIINELPVEEYLYSVVPSEMPANYPIEALKAQAICARTYAYLHVLSPAYLKWNAHVDDTTSYQVYHSVEEQETTTRAVNETEGMVLIEPEANTLAQTYYYSTSCGYGSDAHVWRTKYADSYPYIKSKHINPNNEIQAALSEEEFKEYINKVNKEDYESAEGWYRWTYHVDKLDATYMLTVLQKRYEANSELILTLVGDDFFSQPIDDFREIRDIQLIKREAGGVADELLITTDAAAYKVITELNIRYVLNDGCSKVLRQDGVAVDMPTLLPSAFISLEPIYKAGYVQGYHIKGGGFGHGAGMSQNAAKGMANVGMSAEEILAFFFENCIITTGCGKEQ